VNNNDNKKIPSGWIKVNIEEICDILDSFRKPINTKEREIRIKQKKAENLFPYYGATGQAGVIDNYLLEGEFVLIGEDGAPFLDFLKDKAYLVSGKIWVNNHAHILSSFISNKYLCYYLNIFDYRDYVTGTTRLKLNQSMLKKITVLLPPMIEQKRIVEKIEELLSELDKGIETLKIIQQQLKVYRQSVLKWAFEGRLTEQWRKVHLLSQIRSFSDSIKSIQEPNPPLSLPNSWKWLTLGDCSKVTGGITKNTQRDLNETKKPFLRVANVYANRLELTEIHYIGVNNNELDRVLLKQGDLLFVEGNGSIQQIGRAAIWNDEIKDCVHQNHLIKVRCDDQVFSKFVMYFYMSHSGRKFIEEQASSTSGLFTLSISKIKNLKLPLTSLKEQEVIIQEIESRLSICDKLEVTIEKSMKQAELLRRSILKKAYEGKLVPQGPNDEPAELLLERIRRDREEQSNKTATQPKRSRK
jgi:type I restriction enzyme S subunit